MAENVGITAKQVQGQKDAISKAVAESPHAQLLRRHRETPPRVVIGTQPYIDSQLKAVNKGGEDVLSMLMNLGEDMKPNILLGEFRNLKKGWLQVDQVRYSASSGGFQVHIVETANALKAAKATPEELEDFSWIFLRVFEQDQIDFLAEASAISGYGTEKYKFFIKLVGLKLPSSSLIKVSNGSKFGRPQSKDLVVHQVYGIYQFLRVDLSLAPPELSRCGLYPNPVPGPGRCIGVVTVKETVELPKEKEKEKEEGPPPNKRARKSPGTKSKSSSTPVIDKVIAAQIPIDADIGHELTTLLTPQELDALEGELDFGDIVS